MEGRPPLCALVSHVSDYSRFQAIPQYKKFPIHLHFRVICGICCKTVVKLNKHPGLNVWKCLFFKRFLKWHDSYYLYYLYTKSAFSIIPFPAVSCKSYLRFFADLKIASLPEKGKEKPRKTNFPGFTCARGFEPPTPWSVAKCSIQLSYAHISFPLQYLRSKVYFIPSSLVCQVLCWKISRFL